MAMARMRRACLASAVRAASARNCIESHLRLVGNPQGVKFSGGWYEHVAELTRDIEAAKQHYAPDAPWSAESVGYFMQAVLQGAFIFAKAKQNPEVAVASLGHLRRYLVTLLGQPQNDNLKEKKL
jgi:hypothetical protein